MLFNYKESLFFQGRLTVDLEGQNLLLLVHCASMIMTCIYISNHLFFIMNVILHSFGLYLISKASKEFKRRNVQIENISVATVLLGLVHEIRGFLPAGNEVRPYLLELQLIFKIPYYLSTILLSIDRFCAAYMHLQYPGSWIAHSAFKMIPISGSFNCLSWFQCLSFKKRWKAH